MNLEVIQPFFDTDFLKNIVAEVIGMVVEMIIIYFIISKLLERNGKKNFTIYISPLIEKLISEHKYAVENINKIVSSDELPIKFQIWMSKTISLLDEINGNRIYENYPTVGGKVFEYSIAIKEMKTCTVRKKYNKKAYENLLKAMENLLNEIKEMGITQKSFNNKTKEEFLELGEALSKAVW